MSLKRLYNMFNSTRLTRKDIKQYGETSSQSAKQRIELKSQSSDFDTDALDGWVSSNLDISTMKSLDKRFAPHTSTTLYRYIGGASLLVITVVITLIFSGYWRLSESTKAASIYTSEVQKPIIVEESDLILPENIDLMKDAPIANQIDTKTMVTEFAQMIKIDKTEKEPIKVNSLPIKEISNQQLVKIVTNRKFIKELFLSDLKLVDYSSLRTNPTVEVKQILLTGTPANKEDENSELYESEWKTMDIPYIEYIEKSFRVLNKSNFKKALTRFDVILESYPDDINATFYKGFCLFNLGEYDLANTEFEKCLNHTFTNFDEEAQWMLAQSFSLNGNSKMSREVYLQIVGQNGFYSKLAKQKLSK